MKRKISSKELEIASLVPNENKLSFENSLAIIKNVAVSIIALLPFAALAQVQVPSGTGLSTTPIFDIIRTVMMWLLGLLGFFAVIGFVISGIMYLVAAGDEDSQKKAKKAMFYSITGVIVGLVGLIVLVAAQTLLKGQSNQF